ncbi:hypothetical protein LA080_001822 [Diaporthe eres]|nr:hypothetical protein LA080_001822 [Diaporthe eres]
MSECDPTKIPLSVAPPGQSNDVTGGPSQAWMPRLAIYTTLPVAVGFVLSRIYARLKFRIAFGWDDVIDDVNGRHSWNILLSSITEKAMQSRHLCYFFRRIFSSSLRSRFMIWTGIILTTVAYAAFFTAWIVITVPHAGEEGWISRELALRMGQSTPKIVLGLGVLGTFTDFYIIAIPLMALLTLHMSLARKIGVLALFATGFLVGEINVGIVCACVPVAFPIFKSMSSESSSKWNSWRQYLLKSKPTANSSQELTGATGNTLPAQRQLPRVPKGNLNTLLSFVKGARHTTQNSLQGQKSQQIITIARANDIEMTPYSELRTIDTDNMILLDATLGATFNGRAALSSTIDTTGTTAVSSRKRIVHHEVSRKFCTKRMSSEDTSTLNFEWIEYMEFLKAAPISLGISNIRTIK